MDVVPAEGENWGGGTEMDTAPEMEAAIRTEMDWEQVDDKMPSPAEALLPLAQLMELLKESQASSNRVAEGTSSIPEAENLEISSHVTMIANEISRPQPVSLVVTRLVVANAAKPIPSTPAAIETAAEAAERPQLSAEEKPSSAATEEPKIVALFLSANALPPPPRAITPPPSPAPVPAPTTLSANAFPLLPRAVIPPPPLAPVAAPIVSIPKTIKIVLKHPVPNIALAALRPTISSWSPLGRLLSQQKPISQVEISQVLGKKTMQDWEDSGRDKKKAKVGGEFKFEVGGKRKREDEKFPGKKRVLCHPRVLVVPSSRLIITPLANLPTSTSAISLPPPAPSSHSHLPPPPAIQPLPANHQLGLAKAIKFYNDLPTLMVEIAWMRAQRLNTSVEETRGKTPPNNKKAFKNTATPAFNWSRYRENLSR